MFLAEEERERSVPDFLEFPRRNVRRGADEVLDVPVLILNQGTVHVGHADHHEVRP